MKNFRNILLVSEGGGGGTRKALANAAALARRNGGRLTVLGIAEPLPGYFRRLLGGAEGEDPEARALAEVRRHLELAVEPCRDEALPIEVDAVTGTAFLEVVHRVLRHGHDLVIAHATGGVRGWFGSTATHLLRKCPCPVWIVRPEPVDRYESILAAVDCDPSGDRPEGLNRRILEIATSLARQQEAALHVMTAWSFPAASVLRSRYGLSPEEYERIEGEARAVHAAELERLLGKVDVEGLDLTRHLVPGSPAVRIPELAEEIDAGLLVMGTVGRVGILGFLIGNTAETVLAAVDRPVIAVKPEGFVTPLGNAAIRQGLSA